MTKKIINCHQPNLFRLGTLPLVVLSDVLTIGSAGALHPRTFTISGSHAATNCGSIIGTIAATPVAISHRFHHPGSSLTATAGRSHHLRSSTTATSGSAMEAILRTPVVLPAQPHLPTMHHFGTHRTAAPKIAAEIRVDFSESQYVLQTLLSHLGFKIRDFLLYS